MPTSILKNKSPFPKLFDRCPDYNFLKTFGAACWSNLRPFNKHKMDLHSKLCVFMRYSPNYKCYCCLHIPPGRTYISCDVIFHENLFFFASESQTQRHVSNTLGSCSQHSTPLVPLIHGPMSPDSLSSSPYTNPIVPEPVTTSETPICTSSSSSTPLEIPESMPSPTVNPHPMATSLKANVLCPKVHHDGTVPWPPPKHSASLTFSTSSEILEKPVSYTEVARYPEWRHAMQMEFPAFIQNST